MWSRYSPRWREDLRTKNDIIYEEAVHVEGKAQLEQVFQWIAEYI